MFVPEQEFETRCCRSRSICMTLVNLLVIEEDVQNEIHSFHSVKDCASDNAKISNSLLAYKNDENFLKRQYHWYQLHIIWAGWTLKEWNQETVSQLETKIDSLKLSRPMLTILSRERQYCTTEGHYKELLGKQGWVSGRKTETSIGDDLYDFSQRLNAKRMFEIGWREAEFVHCFHISEISNKELMKLQAGDQEFKNSFFKAHPDVPKEQKAKSENERKYALSLCFRKTEVRGKNSGYFSQDSLRSLPL